MTTSSTFTLLSALLLAPLAGLRAANAIADFTVQPDMVEPGRKLSVRVALAQGTVKGASLQVARRERPWLLIEDGKATHLFTSVYDGEAAWNQSVPIEPSWIPEPLTSKRDDRP